jgi:hypothetical protein
MRWTLLFLAPIVISAATPRIVVENSDPELDAFAKDAVVLCEQWYPKINEILFGAKPPNPPEEIRIVFTDTGSVSGYAKGQAMYLSATEAKRPAKLDFRAVVIHELVHIVQSYPEDDRCDGLRILGCVAKGSYYAPTWIKEGIADYVAYTYFTGTNRPYLQINSAGALYGYDESIPFLYNLQQNNVASKSPNPAGRGYLHGYTVAAAFLLWIEKTKDPDIVKKANAALWSKDYNKRFWKRHTKLPLDKLWAEFMQASMANGRK